MNMHRVMVLAVDGVLPMDLGIPTQIFNARPNTPYELTVCGDTEEAVTTSSGFTLGLTAGLEALAEADTIIVPGFEDFRRPPRPRVRAALKLAGRAGIRIASICTGAFAVASAGLLDGRTVTTHWAKADDLEELYPRLRVDRNVLYIDNDTILTSAGFTVKHRPVSAPGPQRPRRSRRERHRQRHRRRPTPRRRTGPIHQQDPPRPPGHHARRHP
ncbi:AraC family transcriptional regulator [Streptomyces sp. S1D4-11]